MQDAAPAFIFPLALVPFGEWREKKWDEVGVREKEWNIAEVLCTAAAAQLSGSR